MAFEWDEEKAAENLAKHGIPFEYATRVFDDPYHIEAEDPGFYDEIRYDAIGMVENFLLFVAFTYRQDKGFLRNTCDNSQQRRTCFLTD